MSIIAKLIDNAAVTGPSTNIGYGGQFVFDVAGTFNGATVKLQRLASDWVTWLDVGTEATFTAAGQTLVTISAGQYRAAVSGGPPSGIYSQLRAAFK